MGVTLHILKVPHGLLALSALFSKLPLAKTCLSFQVIQVGCFIPHQYTFV